eukprot:TRINITY_DN13505_c0_g1_i1.p1 TRINITY_DN13505_c0_g1~~TRINITY_DN13505_c0_g1_i1.p1  ORF type:complete len:1110 (+),score=256.99 TRINITY_DN13505_c0_g1_i1:115-3444(+)
MSADGEDEGKKGNAPEEMRLKVFARVRPPFPGEFDKGGEMDIVFGEGNKSIVHGERVYEFDEVFPGDTQQDDIFVAVAKPTIDNAFVGFTGTVFVYGQTGTGKTHTMSNRYGKEEDHGIIPRAMQYLFDRIEADSANEYTVTLQYLQLYRDNLQDLQTPDTPFLKLSDAPGGGTIIHGVTTSPEITCVDGFFKIYDAADKNRVVAETMMNKQSSRGHSVLTVFLKRKGTAEEGGINGKLVFVDLAGYERIKKTMITDEVRKHEAQAINLSLSALATCIAAITAKAPHVPFRNSRLTRVLYDSLCGNSVTSVIITMGPSSAHHAETGNTLYFGHNAIQCKTSVKRDLGPIDWQKEAIQWKKKAQKLSEQVTELEAENALLLNKLGADPTEEDDEYDDGDSRGQSQRDLSRRHSGIAHDGLDTLVAELKEANLRIEDLDVQLKKSDNETEEAKIEIEELSWLLEQEKSKVLGKETAEEDLKRQLQQLTEQHAQVTGQLESAEAKLEQLLPSDDLLPTSDLADDQPPSPSQSDHAVEPKRPKNVYIRYDPAKYMSWCDLVRAEQQRSEVRGSVYDRGHWFVSVPDFSSYVADDRKNFEYAARRKATEKQLDTEASVRRVWVSGRAACRQMVTCSVDGVPDDHPRLKLEWETSRNGFDFTGIATGTSLPITSDLVHSYIRASALYMDKRKVSSGLVYVNIDASIDEQLQHFAIQGGVQFPVGVAEGKLSTRRILDGMRVNLGTPPRFAGGSVLSLESTGGVFLRGQEGDVREGTVSATRFGCTEHSRIAEVDLGAGPVLLELATDRDRELLVLTARLFRALRLPKVGRALLGDMAESWLSDEWLKQDASNKRILLPRLRAVTRTGHCQSPHGSPSRRAGGETTFFQRAEELQEGIASPPPSPIGAASDGQGFDNTLGRLGSPRLSGDFSDVSRTFLRKDKAQAGGGPVDLESFIKSPRFEHKSTVAMLKSRRHRAQSGAVPSTINDSFAVLSRATERNKRKSETAMEGLRCVTVASEPGESPKTTPVAVPLPEAVERRKSGPLLAPPAEDSPASLTQAALRTRADRLLQSDIISSVGDSSEDKLSPGLSPSRAPSHHHRKRSVRVPRMVKSSE